MDQTSDFTAELAKLLGLDADTDPSEVLAALKTRLSETPEPDPREYVPIQAVKDLLRSEGQKTATMAEDRARMKVDAAFAKGHLSGPMKDWALALCLKDEESFDAFVAGTPPMFAHLKTPTHTAAALPPSFAQTRASDAALAVCTQLGIDPDKLDG